MSEYLVKKTEWICRPEPHLILNPSVAFSAGSVPAHLCSPRLIYPRTENYTEFRNLYNKSLKEIHKAAAKIQKFIPNTSKVFHHFLN